MASWDSQKEINLLASKLIGVAAEALDDFLNSHSEEEMSNENAKSKKTQKDTDTSHVYVGNKQNTTIAHGTTNEDKANTTQSYAILIKYFTIWCCQSILYKNMLDKYSTNRRQKSILY